MNLSVKEIENIKKLDPRKRYKYFIKKIADYEELWTIVDKNGDIALSDINEFTFVSFWTDEAFIHSNLFDGWEECTPFKIDLDNLEETLVPFISENNYLLNVFPIDGKSGFVVNLDEFIRDLNEELKNYE